MQVVDAPKFPPGCDFVSGLTPDGPWIDTGYEDADGDRYYVSQATLFEMVRLMAEADDEFRRRVYDLVKRGEHVCQFCGRDFPNHIALIGHLKSHAKELERKDGVNGDDQEGAAGDPQGGGVDPGAAMEEDRPPARVGGPHDPAGAGDV